MAPLQQQLGESSCSPAGKPTASGPRAQPSTFQRCAMPRCTVQCQEMLCNGMLCCAVPRNVVQHHAVLFSARKCHTMSCCTMPRCTVQWHAMPCNAVEGHKTLHRSLETFPLSFPCSPATAPKHPHAFPPAPGLALPLLQQH